MDLMSGALIAIVDHKLNLRKKTPCSVWKSSKMGAGCTAPTVDYLLLHDRKTTDFNVIWVWCSIQQYLTAIHTYTFLGQLKMGLKEYDILSTNTYLISAAVCQSLF